MRLRSRLALVFGALGLVTVTGVSTVAYLVAADEVRAGVDRELRQRLEPLAMFRSDELLRVDGVEGESQRARELAESFLENPDDFIELGDTTSIRFLWSDGTFTGGPGTSLSTAELDALEAPGPSFQSITIDDSPYRVVTSPTPRADLPVIDGRTPIGIQLFRDVSGEEQTLDDLAVRLALLSTFAVAVLVVTSLVIGRWLSRPITRLSETAETLAELDDLPRRVEIRRSDEIGQMAESYNRLLSAIEVGREQQQRLVADASHELRTPLTSLRMRLEHLQSDSVEPERRTQILAGAVDDTEQLSILASDLVDLAAAVRSAEEMPTQTRLADLVGDVADRVEHRTGRGITVEADDTVSDVRPTMVRRAIHNLLDNAVKYSPDGAIEVTVSSGRLEVRDHGAGIPSDDLAHVFDRFFRSPKARNRPGNGIGLAIVREVAEVHGGTVWARNEPDGGATVGFSVA